MARVVTIFFILTLSISSLYGQDRPIYKSDSYTVLFWNVENYFAPNEEQNWSWSRFRRKRDQIAQLIISLDKEHPIFVGLVEVENRFVLNRLIYDTPLRYGNYRIIHYDSPDFRGIDVALLYRTDLFRPLISRKLPVKLSDSLFSRDILYIKGVIEQLDTVHLFVNHWPSKFGGAKFSSPKRVIAAEVLAQICDSILAKNCRANILAMGDFNDTIEGECFNQLTSLKYLQLGRGRESHIECKGTIKYLGIWEKIDHFFASPNLLDGDEPISIVADSTFIFSPKQMLERDRKYGGLKPIRTFIGPRYNGGASDHLPIVTKIVRNW